MKYLIFISLAFTFHTDLFSQDHYQAKDSKTHQNGFHLSVAFLHTFIPESTVSGKEVLTLPTFSFDIDYYFNSRFGLGLHNDLELLTFEIIGEEGIEVEREFPLVLTLDLLYQVDDKFVLFAGPGIEFEQAQNFELFRLGVEYLAKYQDRITFAPMLSYDFRYQAYNTFSLGIAVGLSLH